MIDIIITFFIIIAYLSLIRWLRLIKNNKKISNKEYRKRLNSTITSFLICATCWVAHFESITDKIYLLLNINSLEQKIAYFGLLVMGLAYSSNAFLYFATFKDIGISRDKVQIILPVPIGSTVYNIHIDCFDGCSFQKEKFNEIFGEKDNNSGRCGKFPCYTRKLRITPEKVTLNNIKWLLDGWNKNIFASQEEAENYGKKIIQENRSVLISLGFKLDKNGYSLIE
ncbi:MAG: hypothetical protein Q4D26_11060 [Clostridia bacterium]|nr:hypothetical protein [Clostridia bacterium]